VRLTHRYTISAVVDDRYSGRDAGDVLDGNPNGIPVVATIDEAIHETKSKDLFPTHFVIGLAPDGGRLGERARNDVRHAITAGLNIVSGLHDYLSDDRSLADLAREHGVTIHDIRKPPPPSELHFFSGRINDVKALKVAVLGTDSAVGKRTTAWRIVEGLIAAGFKTEMIGTGQTAWLQGARHSIMLDALVNDFLTGEIEHAVVSAWGESRPDVIVIEGQGGLLNPAYPGGYEIIAAARPDAIVLQHAPARTDYDGFPGFRIEPLPRQIQALEVISGKPVVALAINHEGIPKDKIPVVCDTLSRATGLTVADVLVQGAGSIVDALAAHITLKKSGEPKDRL
jgi:uncharacterized NAD-dependent epimerase/dehydratase family protein